MKSRFLRCCNAIDEKKVYSECHQRHIAQKLYEPLTYVHFSMPLYLKMPTVKPLSHKINKLKSNLTELGNDEESNRHQTHFSLLQLKCMIVTRALRCVALYFTEVLHIINSKRFKLPTK